MSWCQLWASSLATHQYKCDKESTTGLLFYKSKAGLCKCNSAFPRSEVVSLTPLLLKTYGAHLGYWKTPMPWEWSRCVVLKDINFWWCHKKLCLFPLDVKISKSTMRQSLAKAFNFQSEVALWEIPDLDLVLLPRSEKVAYFNPGVQIRTDKVAPLSVPWE